MRWAAGVACLLCFCLPASAATYKTQQWRAVEITLTSARDYPNPFQDVDVNVTFTGPDARVIQRPAFWDGGRTWRVRFAPPAVGNWKMTTSATDSANAGLSGVRARVRSVPYSGSLKIYRHGFLKVSSNGRYLVYADGIPFFYLGDTHWILAHERFSTSNAPGVASQFKYVVDKRVAQGFTVFQSEAGWQAPSAQIRITDQNRTDEEADANLQQGITNTTLAGFANLDRKYKYIADHGLVHANAGITWVGDPAAFPAFNERLMARLGRYWAARYGAYPVIWTVAQEVDKNYYKAYDRNTIRRWYAAAQGMTDNDGYHHPVMPHMENTDHTTSADSWWGSQPFHNGWAVQWQGDLTDVDKAKTFWNSTPGKPSILYESPYDHFWTDSRGALGAAYKAFQYGMYGYGYGANGLWNDIYSRPGEAGDYGTAYEMPKHYLWWKDGADLPTGDQLTRFKQFYEDLAWWKLVPRFDDPAWGSFADKSRSLLSSDGQETFVVFFFGEGRATGTLHQLADGQAYLARWFDPREGKYQTVDKVRGNNGQWTIPERPTAEDWVLILQIQK